MPTEISDDYIVKKIFKFRSDAMKKPAKQLRETVKYDVSLLREEYFKLENVNLDEKKNPKNR